MIRKSEGGIRGNVEADTSGKGSGDSALLSHARGQQIFEAARLHAERRGFQEEEGRDCAARFVGHLLEQLQNRHAGALLALKSESYLHRCAENWVKNVLRQLQRHHHRETLYAQGEGETASVLQALVYRGPAPGAQLYHSEMIERILAALAPLTDRQWDLFVRVFLLEESQASIVQTCPHGSTGSNPEAVRKAISALRLRVRSLLEKANLNEQEIRDYFALVNASGAT